MTAPENLKRCTKCGEWKPATSEYFGKWKGREAARLHCKVCCSKASKEYRRTHHEEVLERRRKWRIDNHEEALEHNRKWRAAHREEIREYNRKWCIDNHEKALEYRQRRYAANPKREIERSRKWRQANPAKARAQSARGRARRMAARGSHTADDIEAIYASQKGRCYWCQERVGKDYHVDHRIPMSRGGTNNPDNIVIACPHCNQSKKDKLPHEWAGQLF